MIQRIDEIDIKNKAVFLRLDLNVPLQEGKIADDTRISKALPTIRYILEHTSKLVIASHLGRPKGKPEAKYSLEVVGFRLGALLQREVLLVQDYDREPIDQLLTQLKKDQIVLLENLRFFPGEEKNDTDFAKNLQKGIQVFVCDAFGAIHRAHASVDQLPRLFASGQKAMGFLIANELKALDQIKEHAKAPYCVLIGGSKVSDKIGVILNLVEHCNHLIIAGAMAYTFLKYQGYNIGSSLCEPDKMDLIETIYRNCKAKNVKVHLPIDHVVASSLDSPDWKVIDESAIPQGMCGFDIGPKTIKAYRDLLMGAKTVFWNGPCGVFEKDAYSKGTLEIAKALAESRAHTVVGGGDSVAAVVKADVADKMTHISTGGGASLEYLEGKKLPGIMALQI